MKRFLIVCTVLATALLQYSCDSGGTPFSGRASYQELELLPPASKVIMFADVRAINNSVFVKENEDLLQEKWHSEKDRKSVDEFFEKTGIDLKKDIVAVYFALASGEGRNADDRIAVVVNGNFDLAKVAGQLDETLQEKPGEWDKKSINMKIMFKNEHDDNGSILLLDDQNILIGNSGWLEKIAAGTRNKEDNFRDMLQDVRSGKHFWVVVNKGMNELLPGKSNNPFTERFAPLLMARRFALSAEFSDKLNFEGFLQFDEEQNSRLFADLARGGLAAARLAMVDNPAAVDALNEITIETKDKRTYIRGEITARTVAAVEEQSNKY
ncbi:MAG TPA: hypothetical protein ENJ29_05000 [Bacteroidetes bacterium]|nr:hypothetical protein [Bacteroidota bacterium]